MGEGRGGGEITAMVNAWPVDFARAIGSHLIVMDQFRLIGIAIRITDPAPRG